jgi:sugar phosphate isomerase/epimerase
MKISTEIASIAELVGEHKAVELCAKAGFDGWDFSMFAMGPYNWRIDACDPSDHPLCGSNYLQFARELRRIGEDNGIRCNQSHAPFPVHCAEVRGLLKRAIACTAEAGGEICVIHPDNDKSPEENAEMYNELLPFAKDCGVKLATENMWNWAEGWTHIVPAACSTSESFNAHLDAVNDDYLVACLDIGHAEMRGSGSGAVNMIHALGKRLKCLHLHDNDLLHDSHQLPYSMQIDFNAVLKALKEVGYDGELTLEVDQYLKVYNEDNVFKGVQKMAETAKLMASYFD